MFFKTVFSKVTSKTLLISSTACASSGFLTLKKTDEKLQFIDDFNKRLNIFDQGIAEMENWLLDGRKRLDLIKNPPEEMSPEDRVTKSMELQEDISLKKFDHRVAALHLAAIRAQVSSCISKFIQLKKLKDKTFTLSHSLEVSKDSIMSSIPGPDM